MVCVFSEGRLSKITAKAVRNRLNRDEVAVRTERQLNRTKTPCIYAILN